MRQSLCKWRQKSNWHLCRPTSSTQTPSRSVYNTSYGFLCCQSCYWLESWATSCQSSSFRAKRFASRPLECICPSQRRLTRCFCWQVRLKYWRWQKFSTSGSTTSGRVECIKFYTTRVAMCRSGCWWHSRSTGSSPSVFLLVREEYVRGNGPSLRRSRSCSCRWLRTYTSSGREVQSTELTANFVASAVHRKNIVSSSITSDLGSSLQ